MGYLDEFFGQGDSDEEPVETANLSESIDTPGYVPTDRAIELGCELVELQTKEILYAATAALIVKQDGRKWAKLLMDNFKK